MKNKINSSLIILIITNVTLIFFIKLELSGKDFFIDFFITLNLCTFVYMLMLKKDNDKDL